MEKAEKKCNHNIAICKYGATPLTRQLHEIEEQEQYNLLEKPLELQLSQDDKQDDTKKQLKQIEILKQAEKNEQQREYDSILQQLKQYEKLEINQMNSQHKQKTNNSNHHHRHSKEFVYIHQQKHILELKLTIIKENQMKTRKILHQIESPIYIEIPISNNATETTWVSDGVTMKYLKICIDEISGGYFGYLPTTTAAAAATTTTSLHKMENKCSDYPSTNLITGFVIGMTLIILLLSINLVVMILTKRSKYRTRMENISGGSLRFNDLFPDLNQPQRRQQQQQP
ncbi:unnamed protein product [Rotaria socialis]